MMMRIPNFRGQRALLLHPRDRNCAATVEQLERLGMTVSVTWPAVGAPATGSDVVFFDSDLGFDEMFGWPPGQAEVPLIAILGSEAPGRLEWTLSQEPSAYLVKPVGSTGVFSALSIAFHNFTCRRAREQAVHRLEERLQGRGVLLRATVILMNRYDIGDEEALRILRAESMRRRTTLEAVSALVLSGKWIPMHSPPRKQSSGRPGRRATSG